MPQDPARVGLAEIRYIEGLYKMWDDILKVFPHLFIETVRRRAPVSTLKPLLARSPLAN